MQRFGIFVFISIFLLPVLVWAQSEGNPPLKLAKVTLLDLDQEAPAIELRVYTNPDAGEYKEITCYVDTDSRIMEGDLQIKAEQLAEGSWVDVENLSFDTPNRSCGLLKVITDEAVIEKNVPLWER